MPPFWRKPDDPLPPSPDLLSLTPKYDPADHGVYVSAIEMALTGPDSKSVRNLALSGGYGVGKSSILGEVARRHKRSVITISLSTLGFADEPAPASGIAKTASSRTNRIQKEIVKQLLYSQDPVKMPGSRYRRMSRFRFWRELGLASLVALPIALVFYLSGWATSLAELTRLPAEWADLVNVGIYIAAVFFIVGVRKVMHNRIHIEKVSTGGATIALSSQSATFFDEYIDEIVYFFERTSVDLVILEDIDRFDDAHIFETLRSLNTLLNTAKQLGGRNIRFLYAIKDSIFDQLGQRAAQEELDADEADLTDPKATLIKLPEHDDDAEVELARANRTKFFDQVIPVVPFVTHLSARNLLKKTLDGVEHKVTTEMIDLVGRHIADMRLIKNVRNEFAIFREQLRSTGSLDLSDNGILAMVLYKSTHLTDFERIKHRQSDLDKLYDDFRDLVNANTRRLNLQIQQDRAARTKLQAGTVWSKGLGDRLVKILEADLEANEGTIVDRGFSGEPLDDAAMRTPATWERIASGEAVVVNYSRRIRSVGTPQLTATYTKPMLATLLGDINPSTWTSAERTRLDKRIREAGDSVALLRTADMQTLLGRVDFTLTAGGNDDLAHILDERLGSELARQLVRHGYIDQNFTLFTSTFHAVRVSVTAANFMLKNVDRHRIDTAYPLSRKDVKSVIREKGRSVLEDRSAYNVSIVNYLLAHDSDGASIVTRRLAAFGEEERAFLLAYMADGKHHRALVKRLAPVWSGILPFLVTEASLNDELRLDLVNAALGSLSDDLDYEGGDEVRAFLATNLDTLALLHSDDASEQETERIAGYLAGLALLVPELEALGLNLRASVIGSGGFAVTRKNLLLAMDGSPGGIALDVVKDRSASIYQRVLGNLPDYVDALAESDVSVATTAGMQSVVTDVLTADPGQLQAVVEHAADGIRIADLATVPSPSWSSLAAHNRFAATFANVTAYVEEEGLDNHLGHFLLSEKEIQVGDEDADDEKRELAHTILAARDEIPPASVRAELVRSLGLGGPMAASEVPASDGELVGWLIGGGIIPDDAASFARISSDDWNSRELAISKSASFVDYMTTAEVQTKDIGRLVTSSIISGPVKYAVVDRIAEFVSGSTYHALQQVADFAISSGRGMSTANLTAVAKYIGASRTLSLLRPHLDGIDPDELISILRSVGGEHAKLAGPTGKRPTVDQTEDLDALVRRLQGLGWVSGVDQDGPRKVRVRMGRTAKDRK